MSEPLPPSAPLSGAVPSADLSPEERALVRFSARIAAGSEQEVRAGCEECVADRVPTRWVEEAILQAYLFAGFPRALNATREWRRISGVTAPEHDDAPPPDLDAWRHAGEETCSTVYGKFYEKLRHNIRGLHPALDEWMIVEGYGKILSRPGLDLRRRELCIVAACIAAGQDRQTHSHLHGVLNAGGTKAQLESLVEALRGIVGEEELRAASLLLQRVAR